MQHRETKNFAQVVAIINLAKNHNITIEFIDDNYNPNRPVNLAGFDVVKIDKFMSYTDIWYKVADALKRKNVSVYAADYNMLKNYFSNEKEVDPIHDQPLPY